MSGWKGSISIGDTSDVFFSVKGARLGRGVQGLLSGPQISLACSASAESRYESSRSVRAAHFSSTGDTPAKRWLTRGPTRLHKVRASNWRTGSMDLEFTFKAGQPNGSSFRLAVGDDVVIWILCVIECLTRLN